MIIVTLPDGTDTSFHEKEEQKLSVDASNGHLQIILDGRTVAFYPKGNWTHFVRMDEKFSSYLTTEGAKTTVHWKLYPEANTIVGNVEEA